MTASSNKYQVKKRDGSIHGPYSVGVIRAFLMSGKFEAYDKLIIGNVEEPLYRLTQFHDLFELPLGASPSESPSSNTPTRDDQPAVFTPRPPPRVSYPYPLQPETSLSHDQLHALLCKRDENSGARPLFFRGNLLPPDVRPSYGGNLGKFSILKLLSRLHSTEQTGRIHIRQGRETVDIFLEKGHLVYAASSLEDTRLGEVIIALDLTSRANINHALEQSAQHSVSLGLYLLETRLLSVSQLLQAFTEQFKKRVFEACSWRNGLYRFYQDQTTGHHFPIQFSHPTIFQETVFEHTSSAVIDEMLHPCMNQRLCLLKHPKLSTANFELSDQQKTFIRSIRNDEPLRDKIAEATEEELLEEEELQKLVYLLWQVDLISFREELMGKRTRKLLDELDEKINRNKQRGLLERLDLTPGASADEIRSAYLRLAKLYHPDQQPPGTHTLVLRKMEILFAMIAEAYRILR